MSTSGLFEIMRLGGPLMWAILGASIVALAVFAERMVYFHRCALPLDPFLKGITSLLRQGRHDEALERCDEAYGPAVCVIQAAILKRSLSKEDLKELVQEVAQLQMPRLEAHLPLLSTIAYLCPLLGLLGTVVGMIRAFMNMSTSLGATPVNDLAGGIWEALLTTAGGLCVAIPAYAAFNFLVARLNMIVHDMERAGIEIVQVLKTPAEAPPAAVPAAVEKPEAPLPARAAARPTEVVGAGGGAKTTDTPKPDAPAKN